jgi:hypothetical protein
MRPPLLTDETIRTTIRELRGQGPVTGVAVRDLLAARYGVRGGVARIYRLLHELSAEESRPRERLSRPLDSDETREAAVRRADLAEERERVHQLRWVEDTERLKARLAEAERSRHEWLEAQRRIQELTRALAAAHARIQSLEAIRARPAEDESSLSPAGR